MRKYLAKTLIVSLAFFTISLAWSIYNSYVPVFLSGLIKSSTIVGAIMTIDNLFGVIFQPFFGRLSDRTKNRFGRRMPFLLVGIPISALFFFFIPWYDRLDSLFPRHNLSLAFIMVLVILMNFFMSVYRAPAVALMPDAIPPSLRSRANGIIVAIGGVGTIIALTLGGSLYKLGKIYPFMLGSGLMLLALLVLVLFYREPETPFAADSDEEKDGDAREGERGRKGLFRPSLLFMLLTVFFWFCGFEAINSFFTLFCKERFGMNPGDATQMMAPMVLTFMVCCYPGGVLGSKMGRKRALLLGNALIVAAFLGIVLIPDYTWTTISLLICGVGWALINANAYPAVTQMAPAGQTGRYTGYYYAFTFAASIASPILYGLVADLTKRQGWLFLYGGVMFSIGLLFMFMVRGKAISE
ncbi:MAG TPA: MFS transporter [Thermoclostridium caenicola]|nr:MFS transporter [Thermoclostridium caenicola]